jgi:hypothetical protein
MLMRREASERVVGLLPVKILIVIIRIIVFIVGHET